MTVDTKKVTQRREVHYDSLDDLLADAERLVKKLQADGITCYIKMKDR